MNRELAKFPAIRTEFADLVAKARSGEQSSSELQVALKNSKATAEEIDRSAIGTLLKSGPRDVASGILGGKWSASTKLDEIDNIIGADEAARRGWKAAFADSLPRSSEGRSYETVDQARREREAERTEPL